MIRKIRNKLEEMNVSWYEPILWIFLAVASIIILAAFLLTFAAAMFPEVGAFIRKLQLP